MQNWIYQLDVEQWQLKSQEIETIACPCKPCSQAKAITSLSANTSWLMLGKPVLADQILKNVAPH